MRKLHHRVLSQAEAPTLRLLPAHAQCPAAGTTDNLRQRLATHRRRKAGSGTRVGGGPGIELAYVALPGSAGGASAAGAAEAGVIQALQAGGFPLLSTADAVRRGRPRLT